MILVPRIRDGDLELRYATTTVKTQKKVKDPELGGLGVKGYSR